MLLISQRGSKNLFESFEGFWPAGLALRGPGPSRLRVPMGSKGGGVGWSRDKIRKQHGDRITMGDPRRDAE